jgi:DNA primase
MTGDSVERIKEKLSIVDVISPYVELHKAGKNFKGKSPFTSEKTPSFYVSPDRGMYYCFSSSQGGDIFTFVEKMEGVDFKGALKILAEKAGVELVPEDPKKRDWRGTLYQVLEEATKFFELELGKSKDAQEYLQKRKVNSDTKTNWRIGYAPNDWRQLREYLTQKGFADKALLEAGLVKQAEGGKQPYDVFRDRVMFPIMDPSGRVIGFSGRILSKDSEAPKYVNSPETQLFNKSEALFGYDKAKHGIHKLDFSLIVEGQFDVVLSHQAGYKNLWPCLAQRSHRAMCHFSNASPTGWYWLSTQTERGLRL